VAEGDGVILGHLLLTPGVVRRDPQLSALLLCPLAVVPDHQNSGIGSLLITAALDAAAAGGAQVVNVFGDPDYYERFGFRSLLPRGPLPPFDVSAKHQRAWQTLVLADDSGATELVEGERIEWAGPLMTPELWEG
jgi:putative acetyltransferase